MPENLSPLICKLFRFAWQSSSFISIWTLIAYSIERIIVISYPFLRRRVISIRNAKFVCFSVVIVGILGYSPIFFTGIYILRDSEGPINERYCYFNTEIDPLVIIWFLIQSFLLTVIVPPLALIVTNVVLLNRLITIARSRRMYSLIHPIGRGRSSNYQELKAAKDLLILSIITLLISWPTLTWIFMLPGMLFLLLKI